MLFHSPLGVLFTFPSRYLFAIGHRRVFSLGGWSPLLRAGFHVPGATRESDPGARPRLRVRGSHPVSPAFPGRSAAARIGMPRLRREARRQIRPTTPLQQRPHGLHVQRFGLGAVSLAATPAISVDFSSSGYLDVSVPRVASSRPISFGRGWQGIGPAGFPHSETSGSKAVCASPKLIAACRVLLRLPVPRHPPCALGIFSIGPPAPHRGGGSGGRGPGSGARLFRRSIRGLPRRSAGRHFKRYATVKVREGPCGPPKACAPWKPDAADGRGQRGAPLGACFRSKGGSFPLDLSALLCVSLERR